MKVEEGFQPVNVFHTLSVHILNFGYSRAQRPYMEGNPFTTDTVLPSLLKRLATSQAFDEISEDLERFGSVVLTTLRDLSSKTFEPKLVQYNQWGQRVDELQTSEGWRGLKAKMQEEGIIGIFYERRHKELSRVHGFMKQLIATADTEVIFCPLSMTDGSARVTELLGTPEMKKDLFPRLTSRDPEVAYTAGQWMTERPGGSDVSQTETVATHIPNAWSPFGPVYSLNGFKWFSSATDSDIALALARTGPPNSGSRGLSLFLIPLRFPIIRLSGAPRPSALTNNIKIHRLKNKFGTKVLPTAELSLEESEAYLLGPLNQGVKHIAPVLNITRVHSAVSSVGYIRRSLAIATAYSKVRAINGGTQLLKDAPLHVAELAKAHLTYRALTHFVFGAVLLLGKTECGVATEEEELRLRLLTPAIKGFAADKASSVIEECMTALGGQGYMEETGIGHNLQDAMAEKIWEGTVTVLSLDIVRAASEPGVLQAFISWAEHIITSCPSELSRQVPASLTLLRTALQEIASIYAPPIVPLVQRPALFIFSYAASALYLLEHAIWVFNVGEKSPDVDLEVFRRWVEENSLQSAIEDARRSRKDSPKRSAMNAKIVYGNELEAVAASDALLEGRLRAQL
ncbi:acyl-CoA dehydrogenase/oxidase [Irpex rosettiformis]|uniref:Acyl-CoA dehydrogenase/oxidase n=1 Tax=Irpex rosettiformis TaxID=378272 RepID=A0ACB8U0H2_9APHY|nr:acyl-CoA dehydrogenase/oxidase [Irpex rosettiformis]